MNKRNRSVITKSDRVIVRCWSGLGNHFFQYAFGRSKADRSGLPLILEGSSEDPVFQKLIESFPTRYDRIRYIGLSPMVRVFRKIHETTCPRFVTEPTWHFSEKVHRRSAGWYAGYWQSEAYFEDDTERIRTDLTPPRPQSAGPLSILNLIEQSPAAAVHVRRGDYLKPSVLKRRGILSPGYYKRGLEILESLHPGIRPVVFSDDIPWCREYLNLPSDTVFAEGNTDLEDLYLMSRCTGMITAHSTFSWWGAWLNPDPNKTVVMPKQWVLIPGRKFDDIFMKGAIILNER